MKKIFIDPPTAQLEKAVRTTLRSLKTNIRPWWMACLQVETKKEGVWWSFDMSGRWISEEYVPAVGLAWWTDQAGRKHVMLTGRQTPVRGGRVTCVFGFSLGGASPRSIMYPHGYEVGCAAHEGVFVDPKLRQWGGGTVEKLAARISDEGRQDIAPLLGDALEDAGCVDPTILGHVRRAGPHHWGCWLLGGLMAPLQGERMATRC